VNEGVVRVSSPTELVNPRTTELDAVPTLELVRLLHEQDALVPAAVEQVLPVLAELVDVAVARVSAGGRVHYFGAGTSGRLAVLDAAELPPTFGIAADVVVAHQAGGATAFVQPVEDAEDDEGGADAASVRAGDVVIGLAASGRTPYVGAALTAGRARGAVTALVTANPSAPFAGLADYLLIAPTGPEALTGSTRLKAGTAQKIALNVLSSVLMILLGRVYQGLMVDVQATNRKLVRRSEEMLVRLTSCSHQAARDALRRANGSVKLAALLLNGCSVDDGIRLIEQSNGRLGAALARARGEGSGVG
jgi:N-acetylmuramic acid 6-phosphate etherase